MNPHSSFARFFHFRAIRLAAILAIALISSSVAFCGPIHDAARKGDVNKVKALLKADPTLVSSKDKEGNTALHVAALHGEAAVAAALIDAGADVNAKNNYGAFTPGDLGGFFWANGNNHQDAQVLLHVQGLDAKDMKNGYTPLDLALFAFKHKDLLELLVAKGADVNAQAASGSTPLFWAVVRNQKDDADFLLSKGANINAADAYGDTILDCALHLDFDKMVEYLVNKGADVNAVDQSGKRPLTYALGMTSHKPAQILREHGAHE
jgi:ankyrin repeat protein